MIHRQIEQAGHYAPGYFYPGIKSIREFNPQPIAL